MGYTSYNLNRLYDKESDIKKITEIIDYIFDTFRNVYNSIDFDIKIRDNIKEQFVVLTKDLENLVERSYNSGQIINKAIAEYSEGENQINNLFSGLLDDTTSSSSSNMTDMRHNGTTLSGFSVIPNWFELLYNQVTGKSIITHLHNFFEGIRINVNNKNYSKSVTSEDTYTKLSSENQFYGAYKNTEYYRRSKIKEIQQYIREKGISIDATGRIDRTTYQASRMIGMDELVDSGLIQKDIYGNYRFIFNKYSNYPVNHIESNEYHDKPEKKSFWDKIGDTLRSIPEVASDAWDTTSEFASNAWDTTTEFASDAWDTTSEFASNAWDSISEDLSNTWDKATHADYGQMALGAAQIVGGFTEGKTGIGIATAGTALSGGILAPVAMCGGGYLMVDGMSNISDGFGKMHNGWNNIDPDSEEAVDWNYMRNGYKAVFGDEAGETIYNCTQVVAAATTISKSITTQTAIKGYTNSRLAYQLNNGTAGPLKINLTNTNAIIGHFNTSNVPIKTISIKYWNFSTLSFFTGLDIFNSRGSAEDVIDEVQESLKED
ncbi:hypothetical protein SH1V18_45550 [Vallitalea longa]|uniref:Uncharacterized protein n=1 Tax=Vallitalea longa TaxID=2936439 RepID=A0A9W5YGI0_9FIRM|nr:hypothetical protein [Vallitalea longa]GKX32075.1 hypothetical protein SH1V18_45550 [Vallitalea longa]